jgi:hypothetical protein
MLVCVAPFLHDDRSDAVQLMAVGCLIVVKAFAATPVNAVPECKTGIQRQHKHGGCSPALCVAIS